jgi:hypothetical protein
LGLNSHCLFVGADSTMRSHYGCNARRMLAIYTVEVAFCSDFVKLASPLGRLQRVLPLLVDMLSISTPAIAVADGTLRQAHHRNRGSRLMTIIVSKSGENAVKVTTFLALFVKGLPHPA